MTKTIAAIIISLLGIVGFSLLLIFGKIGEPSFLVLLVISVATGLYIWNNDRVESFNISKGQLILKDVKETEASVKVLASAVLEVVETSDHVIMLETFDGDAQKMALEKLR